MAELSYVLSAPDLIETIINFFNVHELGVWSATCDSHLRFLSNTEMRHLPHITELEASERPLEVPASFDPHFSFPSLVRHVRTALV
jgi:hypothetical protein